MIKKASWINKSRQKILAKRGKPLKFEEHEEIYFLGKSFPLKLRQKSAGKSTLQFDALNGFQIDYTHFEPERFQKLINQFYRNEAQHRIPKITEKYAAQMQLFPQKISFRKAKRRWGSCSDTNAISFNYLMMKLPPNVVQYIVVHELAHIQHKHHRKSFWQLVEKHMPDYRELEKELKTYM